MTIRFDSYDADEFITFLPALFIVLIGFAILAWAFYFFIKKLDNSKQLTINEQI